MAVYTGQYRLIDLEKKNEGTPTLFIEIDTDGLEYVASISYPGHTGPLTTEQWRGLPCEIRVGQRGILMATGSNLLSALQNYCDARPADLHTGRRLPHDPEDIGPGLRSGENWSAGSMYGRWSYGW